MPREHAFRPGFRPSWFDALILVSGIAAACALHSLAWWAGVTLRGQRPRLQPA